MKLLLLRIKIFAVLVLAIACTGSAKDLYFQHYDIKNGLSQNTVHRILQDRQGFMWFATKDGLNRFDGQNFRRVNVNDDSNTSSFISNIFEDSEGLIWVGAHNGPCVYDPTTETMEHFTLKTADGKSIDRGVSDFCEAPDGTLIICVEGGDVFVYDRKKQELSKLALPKQSQDIANFSNMYFSPGGRIYIGTFGGGVVYSDDNLKTFEKVRDADGNQYFGHSVINAMRQKGDKLYVATDNRGLHYIDLRTGEPAPVFITDKDGVTPYIRDIMLSGSSEIWLATENGLYIYDIVEGDLVSHLTHNYFDKYSLSDNALYCLFTDREGGIWIGSYFGGVDYLSRQQMQFEKFFRKNSPGSLQAERVRELCRDNDGKIYVGSEDSGLSRFDPESGLFDRVPGIDETNIHGLCIDGRDLWVGTFSQGLKVKNLDNGDIRHYKVTQGKNGHGLCNDYVFTLLRTLHGDIYVGTLSGLQRYNRDNDRFETVPELANIFIYNLLEDSDGNIWAATYSDGLFMLPADSTKWKRFEYDAAKSNSLPSNKVYSVQEDSRNNIWVMTQNGVGVFDKMNGTFDRTFAGVDHIPGVIYRMVDDGKGHYWLTSNHGIYSIDSHSGRMRNFTTADGLPTNQFNYNSSLMTPDGKIYFGSIDGLVAFDPVRYAVAPISLSKPLVSELYVNGNITKPSDLNSPLLCSISLADKIELEPSQNSISFRIATLNYNNPGEQRIKYRLDGVDKDWKYASLRDAMFNYTNLNYGTYKLYAALCDENDDVTGPMLELQVKIKTPFYLQWWAIAFYILVICAVIFFSFYQYRRYAGLTGQRQLEHYVREKEREAFESKIKFFTNVAHEIRTPLTLIKAPLDCVFQSPAIHNDPEAKENLDVINMNVDRLLLLANQLLDFRKIESGNFHITKCDCDIKALIEKVTPRFLPTIQSTHKQLTLELPDHPVIAAVDAESIIKIISNLFTNAIKYGETYIRVILTSDETTVTLRFINDGEVVSAKKREEIFSIFSRLESGQPGAGIGLAYARSLAEMHGGTLLMGDSQKENEFILNIPIGKPDAPEVTSNGETDLEQVVKQSSDSVSVLLVEDNAEMLSFLERKLIACNFHVLTATDGLKALSILGDQYVDIVVSDVMMPEMDGYQLLEHIKGDLNYSHIPVILLTAKTRMEDKLSGLEAGADAYIEKPFAIEYLLVTINSLLRNRERMRQRLESMPLSKLPSKGLSKVDEEFLRKINEIIQSNFNNPEFSMENVIAALGMSRTTFYRKIKGMLDLNPNDYIKIQRLKRAAQLFREGHSSVSEVCYMVGFSSPGYFTKCFQKQFGVSPKDFINGKEKKNEQTVSA